MGEHHHHHRDQGPSDPPHASGRADLFPTGSGRPHTLRRSNNGTRASGGSRSTVNQPLVSLVILSGADLSLAHSDVLRLWAGKKSTIRGRAENPPARRDLGGAEARSLDLAADLLRPGEVVEEDRLPGIARVREVAHPAVPGLREGPRSGELPRRGAQEVHPPAPREDPVGAAVDHHEDEHAAGGERPPNASEGVDPARASREAEDPSRRCSKARGAG